MGKQVNFFAVNSDFDILESALKKIEPFVILKYESPTSAPERADHLRVRRMGEETLALRLCRACDIDSLHTWFVDTQGYWVVDTLTSPVVELNRCYYDGSICRRGRLYFRDGYYLDDGRWLDKPAHFVQWADRVLRLARRTFRRNPALGSYVGPEADELLRCGNVKFDVNG